MTRFASAGQHRYEDRLIRRIWQGQEDRRVYGGKGRPVRALTATIGERSVAVTQGRQQGGLR